MKKLGVKRKLDLFIVRAVLKEDSYLVNFLCDEFYYLFLNNKLYS